MAVSGIDATLQGWSGLKTMSQTSPHIIHFKSIFDVGEKREGILPRIPVSRLAPTIAISLNAASYKCLQNYEEGVYSIKPKS